MNFIKIIEKFKLVEFETHLELYIDILQCEHN